MVIESAEDFSRSRLAGDRRQINVNGFKSKRQTVINGINIKRKPVINGIHEKRQLVENGVNGEQHAAGNAINGEQHIAVNGVNGTQHTTGNAVNGKQHTTEDEVNGKQHTTEDGMNGKQQSMANGLNGSDTPVEAPSLQLPQLLFLSAADEDGVKRQSLILSEFLRSHPQNADGSYLHNVFHTLNTRRTLLNWRAYAVVDSTSSLLDFENQVEKPVRSNATASPQKLGFVFTGQGAQWAGMARELLSWPVFSESVAVSQQHLRNLGCDWKIIGKWMKSHMGSAPLTSVE